ncbi:hypothetical protein [Mycobacteroides abscessus]|uniref:hypothetical protein n=1 Tax=Mycobacteroides abscessus TaxID=36809 RepID=UPI001A92A693|nr:hypothetical protein [Mycobacteroides abscessus]MBL3752924.1 hypothetical protein [Mycobacteroides abscessus subsp. massiliense]
MTEGKSPDDKRGWWYPQSYGDRFYVERFIGSQLVLHRSKPSRHVPRGRIVTYGTSEAAQQKADDLNDQLVEQEALLDATRPQQVGVNDV